jgi:hypothetical protein
VNFLYTAVQVGGLSLHCCTSVALFYRGQISGTEVFKNELMNKMNKNDTASSTDVILWTL